MTDERRGPTPRGVKLKLRRPARSEQQAAGPRRSAPRRLEVPSEPPGSRVVTRTVALSSLARATTRPVPVPVPVASTRNDRKYPRAPIKVKARLSLADDPTRFFEASLPTVNISVGGMFLESSFFLKLGTRLIVTLQLGAPKPREVMVKGEVVRVVSVGTGSSGFALRFTDYFDGSEVVLATYFLSPVLRSFITDYARIHRLDVTPDYVAHVADVLAAWELKKAELGSDVWELTGP